jgi:hypothetical protein
MSFSPILLLHICAGTTGVLSGFVAVFLRKGSRAHGFIGTIFFVAMLGLGSSGAYLALLKSEPGNFLGGTLTCYLVATSWRTATAKRREAKPGIFDWVAFLIVSAAVVSETALAFKAFSSPTGMAYGYPAWPYLLFGSVGFLAATGDIRMLMRGGISGTQRVARHLWRMCFALFIAAGSVFLARPHLFPAILRTTGVLALLSFLPLILMVFWLIRIRIGRASRRKPVLQGSLPTPSAAV